MLEHDPLALRHGRLIGMVWTQIAEARDRAQGPLGQPQAATMLRRIRHLHRLVQEAHRLEMQRKEFSTPAIDGWFRPVEETLTRAERYFSHTIASQKLATAKAG